VNEYGQIERVLLKHPRDAFVDEPTVDAQWRALNFTERPDLAEAITEYERFVELISSTGAAIDYLPSARETTLDSIYVRDAALVTSRGMVLCSMGKRQREAEPDAVRTACDALGIPVIGHIEPPGRIEGGDVIWLGGRTLVVGRGYRTNDAGIEQLRSILGRAIEVIVVPLPHWTGEHDVMHLMSLISPVDADLAVVYSRLLPVSFRQWLIASGMMLVEVPDKEFASMGTNVLALGPRRCLMLKGNPATRTALKQAGATVIEFKGIEISRKGGGGPTCLTRPILRGA
jgi:N-dimethylarginine dimethylaminohydrolase